MGGTLRVVCRIAQKISLDKNFVQCSYFVLAQKFGRI